jgi:hypothetical protein
MARMVRTQIYLEPEQKKLLKQRSKETGVSEAALIREFISEGMRQPTLKEREKAWERARAFMEERAKMNVSQTGRTWTRDELYNERLDRYSR